MKIKVDAEKLIAKYLLGDLTDPEKEQLDNWIKSSPQHEEFFNRLCTNMSFRKRYEAYTQINSHQAWKHFKKKYCQASITSIFLKCSYLYITYNNSSRGMVFLHFFRNTSIRQSYFGRCNSARNS